MNKKKVVIALGHIALGRTLPEQKVATAKAAKIIAEIIANGYQVVISHSNAPQVGMIHTAMNEFGKNHADYSATPMSVCSAMSQGYIGYDLQNAIREELLNLGVYKTVSTVLTQVTVDPYDEAFYTPIKVVGRVMSEEEAKEEEIKGNYVTKTDSGYRRIVAAPKPKDIIELDAIKLLSAADQVVIAGGGGGIPVLEQGTHLKGASAVIEKDLVSARLADELNANILLFLTSVENVYLHYGTAEQTPIDEISIDELQKHMEVESFGTGSMRPKLEGAVDFISNGVNRKAIITSLDKALEGLTEKTGTIIQS